MSIERHDIFNILHNTEIGLQDKGDGSRDFMTKGDAEKLADAIYKLNRPIANNGVSFDSIVDKLTHLNGDHLMGLELNNIHIIANFITRLQTTAPRGGGEEILHDIKHNPKVMAILERYAHGIYEKLITEGEVSRG